jgi:hypothetical protein
VLLNDALYLFLLEAFNLRKRWVYVPRPGGEPSLSWLHAPNEVGRVEADTEFTSQGISAPALTAPMKPYYECWTWGRNGTETKRHLGSRLDNGTKVAKRISFDHVGIGIPEAEGLIRIQSSFSASRVNSEGSVKDASRVLSRVSDGNQLRNFARGSAHTAYAPVCW